MSVRLIPGDCIRAMRLMSHLGVQCDSIVCDPPYHLTSIVKRFGAEGAAPAKSGKTGAYRRAAAGFMGKHWDGGDIAFDPETWKLAMAVLKPGGYLLAFASSRGFGRMSVAIEDAGFITHPMIAWIFGSGFPKATRIKAEGYDGFRYGGQALKPAIEPIYMGQKPFEKGLSGTENILHHGTGAINVDGCRVEGAGAYEGRTRHGGGIPGNGTSFKLPDSRSPMPAGRWPANVCTDGSEEVEAAFAAFGEGKSRASGYNWDDSEQGSVPIANNIKSGIHFADSGTASRFFYSAKANALDRWGAKHPTVKPVNLMRWLVRLVTPPGGLVLDPFAGTGSTGVAALAEGMRAILIEADKEYQADIRARLAWLAGEGRHALVERARHAASEKTGHADLPLFACDSE